MPALKPFSILVLIRAKKTGPVKKESTNPKLIPEMIDSIIPNFYSFIELQINLKSKYFIVSMIKTFKT